MTELEPPPVTVAGPAVDPAPGTADHARRLGAGGEPQAVADAPPPVGSERPDTDPAHAIVAAEATEPSPGTTLSSAEPAPHGGRFTVHLHNFEGPFDLLLQLISQHRMDVTEVALHRVTDEFIAHIRGLGEEWDLDEITEFLVIAATLLDLKAARLLPAAEVEDEEDLALLEARDLLFARLLQYRAYKQVAALFSELEAGALRRYPRSVTLEKRFEGLLPEVLLGVDANRFAEVAAAVFRPRPPPAVSLDHLHMAKVSVREHAAYLRVFLAEHGEASFAALTEDCEQTVEVVARFLALLELYRETSVLFDQTDPLGDLRVRWVGGSVEHARAVAESDRAGVEDEEYG
ncbi:segregation and condensation protein A [Actinoalloteichus hoggarensis]|uniref:Segregation and condensation protein A n=1 Tax=Actinoalloteichus hoggarensis TaxID=1470176 RepID=A0A221W756_9PSEU|nr:segregation/condensation protein A [Actinoalloteichus hoggarensis]ASO21409.1 Segregation and condensation protein A [Actinoalloteichus hoggarensis]MBB5921342.1 segregation and condensation protein A [Actinoalloteichus hoggarensis]